MGARRYRKLYLERIDDRLGDFILNGKHVLQLTLESVRPNMETVARID